MADALLSASLQVLFDRLASPELINFIRRQNLSDELLSKLKRKLLVVHKVLRDAEVKQFSDPLVKEWLVHVKDAAYHAEDLLDEILTDGLQSKIEAADSQIGAGSTHPAWSKFSVWVKAPFSTQSMESRVKDVIAKLEAIAQEKVGLGLKEGGGEKLLPRSPISTSLEDESFVFGRDDIQKEMVNWLLSHSADQTAGQNMEVMSIVGMGGSGKTTLARLLFNDNGVKEHFHLKAWVCVSTEFLLIKVTKSIIEETGSAPVSADNLNLLQLQLKDQLSNKKFLLVLDDVWDLKPRDWEGWDMKPSDGEGWDRLRTPFLGAAPGSKIVVTSRNESVATTMRAVQTHHLGQLSPQHCWRLFEKLAFQDKDSNASRELEPIGRQIVDKCQGLPMAVKAVGRLLYSKVEKREWEDVLNSEIWHLPSGPEILPSLRLSYHHLSLPVKRCFAYCSIFPQDHQFDKEHLILLWMAEGLLHPQQKDGRRMEEVGESYFDELVAKSFFQKSVGKTGLCFVMHDLIHELAQLVSGDFCARVEDDDKVPKVSEKARHFLYFRSDHRFVALKKFEGVTKAKSLRTFLEVKPSFNVPWYILSKRFLQDILPKMRCLRVLALRDYYNIVNLPKSIGNLNHWRYLDLSYTAIEKLPESVCCLCNLQTMILRGCGCLIELPSRIDNLINLRYLDIMDANSLREMPSNIGQLKSLQRLTCFIVGQKSNSGIGELRKLSDIGGTLHISNMKNVVSISDASRANMKDKSYLKELILDWKNHNCMDDILQNDATDHDILGKLGPHPNLKQLCVINYPGVRFPNWFGDHPSIMNLTSLKLKGCGNCSTLPPLGQLTHLKYLQISRMNRVKNVGSEFYGNASFPSLQTLSFSNMLNWETWLCGGQFSHLQKLFIQQCPKLVGKLPEQLLSLEELEIDGCPRLLMASLTVVAVRKLKMVDFGKLQLQMLDNGHLAALQTTEIEILGESQWKQLPMALHQKLSIRGCVSMESLLEDEISQTSIHGLEIYDCCCSRSLQKVGLPATLKSLSISKCSKLEFLLPELFRCHNLPVLESLHIDGDVTGGSFLLLSFSLGFFPKLTTFRINGLSGLEKLSISNISEGDPSSLLSLGIQQCPDLESIELLAVKYLKSCRISNCSNLGLLLAQTDSSIQELTLEDCPELLFQREGLPSDLCKLQIQNCNKLIPQVEWGLQRLTSLTGLRIEGGCQEMELFPEECLLPSSLTCLAVEDLPNLKCLDSRGLQRLTSLQELKIICCLEIQFSAGSVLQHLTSLKTLQISCCPQLRSLTEVGLQQLSSLEILEIFYCQELQYLTEMGVELQQLTSLETLSIKSCPKLRHLTKQRPQDQDLQHLISLKHFRIHECPMVQSLTKLGLHQATSLETLDIINCRKLKYLTKERLPDSLSSLHVNGCPSLQKRCQFQKGEEWPYISHVPEIMINGVLF